MKKIIAFLMLGFVGCTSGQPIGCVIEKTVADMAAPAVATALQCSNQAQVQGDLEAMIGKIGNCTKASDGTKKGLPAPICDMIASVVVSGMSGGIPAAWGCTAANAQTLLKGVISQACQKIP